MINIDDFKKITLADKPILDAFYTKYPVVHSDNMFTTMVSWGEYVDYRYVFIGENIVIMTKLKNGNVQFRAPLGKQNPTLVREVLKLAVREGGDTPFVFVDKNTKDWIHSLFPKLVFFEDRMFFDYVYLTSDLAELKGTAYSAIRNRLNKFQKNHTYTFEIVTKNNITEVQEFLKRWCLWKDCASDELLENERKSMAYSMAYFFDLGLSGLAIRINGIIEAIAVFEQMNKNTAVIHYEKGSPDFDGIYKAINRETAQLLKGKFQYIDRETDMGVPGLRKAKLSYRPHHLVEVFSIEKKNIMV
ncbi:MAG: phosphatidylglycerol lysyltransferase domain-containing protein [Euryarchaeota archaeon]|nr:phosphatidylglycerol lysyltransferase domain-containing protein [Euryarchaeota archaeon]